MKPHHFTEACRVFANRHPEAVLEASAPERLVEGAASALPGTLAAARQTMRGAARRASLREAQKAEMRLMEERDDLIRRLTAMATTLDEAGAATIGEAVAVLETGALAPEHPLRGMIARLQDHTGLDGGA